MVEFKTAPTNSTSELTSEIASNVYSEIKSHGDADTAFKAQTDSSIDPEHFKTVNNEVDRLFSEMNKYASGNVLLEPEVSHFDEETGEKVVDSEAVYYKLTTETDFKSQFSSDYLDIAEVYNDWKGSRTWTEIKG